MAALASLWLLLPPAAGAAELVLDFSRLLPGPLPAEYRPALTGSGSAPDWQLIRVEAPSAIEPLTAQASANTTQTVLAQLSTDATDERFPLLIYEPEVFGDFTAELTFRTVSGRLEQMAGLAFRLQNPSNYYILRASSLGNTLRFYKFVDGVRSDPLGPQVRIPSGEWHTLEVTCKGNTILCRLNGREAIPLLTDSSFTRGRLALWTKSDSVSHFRKLRVTYDVLRSLPERLVHHGTNQFPRLLGITVFGREDGRVIALASSDPEQVGKEAGKPELQALQEDQISAGSTRSHGAVVFPLRDRNGEPLFAVRLKLRTFTGQTDNNIAARGRTIVDQLEALIRSSDAQ